MNKLCKICKKEFIPKIKASVFCSLECCQTKRELKSKKRKLSKRLNVKGEFYQWFSGSNSHNKGGEYN